MDQMFSVLQDLALAMVGVATTLIVVLMWERVRTSRAQKKRET